MVLSHVVDAWTRDADRDRTAFYWATFLGGLAAPAFLFLAGLGSALSGAAKEARGTPHADVVRALVMRGLTIFGLAFVFRFQSFVLGLGSPVHLLKVDVLNVMGPALVLAALLWGTARGAIGRGLLAVATAVGLAMVAPLVHAAAWVDALPAPLQWYVRPTPGHSDFTLLPWTGFVCAGLAAGVALTAAARPPRRAPAAPGARRAGGGRYGRGVLGFAAADDLCPGPVHLLGRVAHVLLHPAGPRDGAAADLLGPPAVMPARLGAALALLGAASLFAYWVHVEIVYGGIAILIKRRVPLELTLVARGARDLRTRAPHPAGARVGRHARTPSGADAAARGEAAVGMAARSTARVATAREVAWRLREAKSEDREFCRSPSYAAPLAAYVASARHRESEAVSRREMPRHLARLFAAASEREQVGELRDERAVDELARPRVAPLVVDEEEVAERAVDDVEPHVRAPLPRVGVVLQQRVQEHVRGEVHVDAAGERAWS